MLFSGGQWPAAFTRSIAVNKSVLQVSGIFLWRKKKHTFHCTTFTKRKISYFWPLHFYESCHQRFLNKYPTQPTTDTIRPLQLSCLMFRLFVSRDMTHRDVCTFIRWTTSYRVEKHLDWSSPIMDCINFNQTQTESILHSKVFYESIKSIIHWLGLSTERTALHTLLCSRLHTLMPVTSPVSSSITVFRCF